MYQQSVGSTTQQREPFDDFEMFAVEELGAEIR